MNQHLSIFTRSFKYWELFLAWVFKYPTRCYHIKQKKKKVVSKTLPEKVVQFGRSYRKNRGKKGIICQVTSDPRDVEKVIHILHEIHAHIKNPILCDWSVAEVLAKVLAYRNLKQGMKIPIPIQEKEKNCVNIKEHQVEEVFELWNKIQAFGLQPIDQGGAPILLFRGTDFSLIRQEGRASILSDLDPKGPGWTLFKKSKKTLHEWLTKNRHPARVLGHSLGGVIAAYTLIHEAKWMSRQKHESSYAFNFPGISQKLLNQWDGLKEKPAFTGFVSRGDLISKFGSLFGQVYEVSFETPLSPIQAHEMLLFCKEKGHLHEVDLDKENRCKSRTFYSKLQKQISSTVYLFFKNQFFDPT